MTPGFLHWHLNHYLKLGVGQYLENFDDFQALFGTFDEGLTQSWFDALKDRRPVFVVGFPSGVQEGANVISTILTRSSPESPTFHALSRVGGVETRTSGVDRQFATINILAASEVEVATLAVLVRATLMRALDSLLRSGYVDVRHTGTGEIAPEEMYMAEQAGLFARSLQYESLSEFDTAMQIAGSTLPVVQWFVQEQNTPNDDELQPASGCGTPGGVGTSNA